MSTTSRVAGAVAAGYVLGRFKKLRMAVLVASAMSSPKFRSAATQMIQNRIPGGAVVGGLTKEVGGKLVDVGKTAATSLVASRIDSLSQNLAERSQNLRQGGPGGQPRKSDAEEEDRGSEEPEDEYEEQEGEEAEQPEDEYEEQEGEEGEEPEDEYEEQEGEEETEQPEDEYEEQEDEGAEQPEEEDVQADDDSGEEQAEEQVARSPRRRRSASPAGRKRG